MSSQIILAINCVYVISRVCNLNFIICSKNSCSKFVFLFWQIDWLYYFSAEMDVATGWRRGLALSFLMVGLSVCLPSIRKGDSEACQEGAQWTPVTSFLHDAGVHQYVTPRWSSINFIDIFSSASHWGIPRRSPSSNAKRSADLPGADVEWVHTAMSPLSSSNSSMSSSKPINWL